MSERDIYLVIGGMVAGPILYILACVVLSEFTDVDTTPGIDPLDSKPAMKVVEA